MWIIQMLAIQLKFNQHRSRSYLASKVGLVVMKKSMASSVMAANSPGANL